MEVACHRTYKHLRIWSPRISHAAAILVLGLTFYYKELDGMGDAINVFLFPDMSPSAVSEAALLES